MLNQEIFQKQTNLLKDTTIPILTKKSIILYVVSSAIFTCAVALLASVTVYPGLRDSFFWPNILVVFGGNFAIPGAIAGGLIKLLSRNLAARISGFLGIVLGVLWQLHLAFLILVEECEFNDGAFVLIKKTGGCAITRLLKNFESSLMHDRMRDGIFSQVFVLILPILLAFLCIFAANFISGIGKSLGRESKN